MNDTMAKPDWRYLPTTMMTLRGMSRVVRYIAHPPGKSRVKCPIVGSMTAIECQCENGGVRWYGAEGAKITSDLHMAAYGGCINDRNEVTAKWQRCLIA